VLADTHWMGGDPLKQKGCGGASWTPEKAILVLRNPAGRGLLPCRRGLTSPLAFQSGLEPRPLVNGVRVTSGLAPAPADKIIERASSIVQSVYVIRSMGTSSM